MLELANVHIPTVSMPYDVYGMNLVVRVVDTCVCDAYYAHTHTHRKALSRKLEIK